MGFIWWSLLGWTLVGVVGYWVGLFLKDISRFHLSINEFIKYLTSLLL